MKLANCFSLIHLNNNLLSFHFDEMQSVISKSKYDSQVIGISETRLKKSRNNNKYSIEKL